MQRRRFRRWRVVMDLHRTRRFAGGVKPLMLSARSSVAAAAGFVPLSLPGPVNTNLRECILVGVIEIELAGGHRLRAEALTDVAVLRSLIEALVGR
jgi:hypothetical protein